MQLTNTIVIIFLALAYLAGMPFITLASALIIHLFLLGFVLRACFGWKNGHIIIESVLLSLVFTAAIGLVIGNYFTVADFASRAIVIAILLAGAWVGRRGMGDMEKSIRHEIGTEGGYLAIILSTAAIPFFIIFLFNPLYSLISDGWWHCSIYNTISFDQLPPKNPWYASEYLGYPYAFHIYLAYATAGMLNCFDGLNLFDFLITAITMFGLYAIGKETFGNKKTAVFAALAFLFISHVGGMAFVYDFIRLLPTLGLEGYLDFLKNVHGPHVYYGNLAFLGDQSVIIPFQMTTMMGAFNFLMLTSLIYFLFKREKFIVCTMLGVLVATNPIGGILGSLIIGFFVLLTLKTKKIYDLLRWVLAAPVSLIIAYNYIQVLFSKVGSVGGGIVGFGINSDLLIGFLIGYAPLVILAIKFFQDYRNSPTRAVWISFILATIFGLFVIKMVSVYFYIYLAIFLAVVTAPWLASIWNRPKKHLMEIILVLILIIPTFLVVGSYSYYIIPLSQPELEAAAWIEENTNPDSIFLVSMDLTKRFNLHQYVPVFGKRMIYLGDPGVLKAYGEDTRDGLRFYNEIFGQENSGTICKAKESGIDYIYVKDADYFDNSCLQEVYDSENVKIYATN